MLKTADEAGDVKSGWVRLSTSPLLRLITSGEAGERRRPATTFARRSPASPEVIRPNGALVLSRTHPVLTSPASRAVLA